MRPDDRRPGDTPPHAPSDDAQASGDGAARLGRERRRRGSPGVGAAV